jgi:glycine amidinotransferase
VRGLRAVWWVWPRSEGSGEKQLPSRIDHEGFTATFQASTDAEEDQLSNPMGELNGCPVNSYNSWDPLEEVIVGRLEGATIPSGHVSTTFNVPKSAAKLLRFLGGRRYPGLLRKRAQKQLDGFIRLLKAEGVTVRRPDMMDHRKGYKTPYWSSRGFCVACPRDGFIVIGNEIIESPMAWRSRFFEGYAYRSLFKEYFAKGARWTAAPKPELADVLYHHDYMVPRSGEAMRYVINDFEPVFDAADFIRCGKDIFVQKSNVTNASGIEWMRRHLGETYRIHEIQTLCRTPMHIDSTIMPLAPGKLLINPVYVDAGTVSAVFKSWDIIVAPQPDEVRGVVARICSMVSPWISINMLMLDEKRPIVERSQKSMIRTLKDHGFDPVPCEFADYAPYGGSFHCATLDIRRRGTLQEYF